MSDFSYVDFLSDLSARTDLLAGQTPTVFEKGEDLFSQGDVASDLFLLQSGLVKLHYVTFEGKAWVKSFIKDAGLVGSRASQELGIGSPFSATCLETTSALKIPYRPFAQACNDDPVLAGHAFRFFQWLGLRKELREYELLCISAEERYRNVLKADPDLVKRITQTDLARFLGITPIALSRIKGRLK